LEANEIPQGFLRNIKGIKRLLLKQYEVGSEMFPLAHSFLLTSMNGKLNFKGHLL
jgi:hypothetical protein